MLMSVPGVLLLNATYEPLTVLSVKRSARLVGKERAVPVTAEQITIEHTGQTMAVPSVLRLKVYINVPKRNAPRWTRRGVFVRDGSRCAYCGRHLKRGELTVDHVFPISRGGGSTWGNTVTACAPCNQRKANRTPHEAGMKLLIEPKTPRTNYLLAAGDIPASWKLWIEL
jgi:5-methylcytosine-specific restriction endonuclease McrA